MICARETRGVLCAGRNDSPGFKAIFDSRAWQGERVFPHKRNNVVKSNSFLKIETVLSLDKST